MLLDVSSPMGNGKTFLFLSLTCFELNAVFLEKHVMGETCSHKRAMSDTVFAIIMEMLHIGYLFSE